MYSQVLKLSPSQCPVWWPDPAKVDREIMRERSFFRPCSNRSIDERKREKERMAVVIEVRVVVVEIVVAVVIGGGEGMSRCRKSTKRTKQLKN